MKNWHAGIASKGNQQISSDVQSETTQVSEMAQGTNNGGRGVIVGKDGAAFKTVPNVTATKTCTPGANTNIVIYQVDSAGQGTQIAQTITDANGVFSFSVGLGKKTASNVVHSFGFSPDNAIGFIKEDGISTSEIHTAKSTDGPTYSYTFCKTGVPVGAQTKGAFAISGKSSI